MELSNVEMSIQNSISPSRSQKKSNNDNVQESNFNKFIKDNIKDTKHKGNIKDSEQIKSSGKKVESNKDYSLEESKNLQKKDEDSLRREDPLENKEVDIQNLEKETLSGAEKLQQEEKRINELVTEILSLFSANLTKLVNNSNVNIEQQSKVNGLLQGISNNENLVETTENKLSNLLVLLKKIDAVDFPKDLAQQILSVIDKDLTDEIDNGQTQNNTKNLFKLVENLSNPSESHETDDQVKLLVREKILENITYGRVNIDNPSIVRNQIDEEKINNNDALQRAINKLEALISNKSGRTLDNGTKDIHQGVINTQYTIYENQEGKIEVKPQEIYGDNISSSEESLLKKFIEGDKPESKISRAANFTHIMNEHRFNFSNVENGDKIPMHISKGTFNEDIVKAIKFMDLNGIKDLSIKIYPKELGEVFISVTMEQGALRATIKATNKDAVDMLNLGLKDINEKLTLNNSKVQSVDIGLYQDTTYFSNDNLNQHQQQQFRQSKKNNHSEQSQAIEDNIVSKESTDDREINLLA